MDNEIVEKTASLWSKKYSDLTVGETVKATGIMMAATLVVPVVVGGIAVGVSEAYDKVQRIRKNRKNKSQVEVVDSLIEK